MHRLARGGLVLVLYAISFNGAADASETMDLKGQLSFTYIGAEASATWKDQATLRYIPDLTIQGSFSDDYLWDLNVSANIYAYYQSHADPDSASSAGFYRLNGQLKTPHSDTTLGLQKINFGPALILRSLRWFDQVSPTDPLQLTEGVKGIRYRYFFMNNANIWLWGLYGNDEVKGYELVATKNDTVEGGGRLQYPFESGELGFTFHVRETERLGFSDISIGEDLVETRLALDGKWDLGPGAWFEYVLIDQGGGSQVNSNWFNMLTIGADYTLALGNGIYALAEHNVSSKTDAAMKWDQATEVSAMQISYPVTILDTISLLEIYSWTDDQGSTTLRWDRTYDDWLFSLAVFCSPDQAGNSSDPGSSVLSGDGIQAVIVFNH